MRSSTIFLVFGIIVSALLVCTILSSYSLENEPTMRVVASFLRATRTHDLKTLNRIIDPTCVTITQAGGKLGGMHFNEVSSIGGAFSRRPERVLSYLQLLNIKIKAKATPLIADSVGLATVPMEDGGRIYLRRIDGDWKIFYVSDYIDETQ